MLLSILGLLLPPTTQHCMVPNAIVPRLRNPVGSFSAEACHIVANAARFSSITTPVCSPWLVPGLQLASQPTIPLGGFVLSLSDAAAPRLASPESRARKHCVSLVGKFHLSPLT